MRKGIANGLHSAVDYDLQRFYPLYAGSVHRLGTPVFARRHFALLRSVFDGDCDILSIYHGQQAQASVFTFYFRDEVLPYYGGGSALASSTGANDFMYWEVMRRACARAATACSISAAASRARAPGTSAKNWVSRLSHCRMHTSWCAPRPCRRSIR